MYGFRLRTSRLIQDVGHVIYPNRPFQAKEIVPQVALTHAYFRYALVTVQYLGIRAHRLLDRCLKMKSLCDTPTWLALAYHISSGPHSLPRSEDDPLRRRLTTSRLRLCDSFRTRRCESPSARQTSCAMPLPEINFEFQVTCHQRHGYYPELSFRTLGLEAVTTRILNLIIFFSIHQDSSIVVIDFSISQEEYDNSP